MATQPTIPVPLEVDIQRTLVLTAAARGVVLWRNNSGAVRTRNRAGRERMFRIGLGKGSSDLIGMLPGSGRLISVEAKRPGETLRQDQWEWLEGVRLRGGIGCWADDPAWLDAILVRLLGPGGSLLTVEIDRETHEQFFAERPRFDPTLTGAY